MKFVKCSVLLVLTLGAVACGKPANVTAAKGEVCHPTSSENAWKTCEGELICLTPNVQEEYAAQQKLHEKAKDLKPEQMQASGKLGQPTITTVSGSSSENRELYDCFGIPGSQSCIIKGKCFSKVAVGEPCRGNDMCEEGECLGIGWVDDQMVWRCMPPDTK